MSAVHTYAIPPLSAPLVVVDWNHKDRNKERAPVPSLRVVVAAHATMHHPTTHVHRHPRLRHGPELAVVAFADEVAHLFEYLRHGRQVCHTSTGSERGRAGETELAMAGGRCG